jgi:hypothetical protein
MWGVRSPCMLTCYIPYPAFSELSETLSYEYLIRNSLKL